MNVADRIKLTAKQEAYITFKDHLDNFANNPTCSLINPAKTNIGRVSKMILESINLKVKEYTKANQWKSTHGVSEWFSNLRSKKSLTFVVFDKVDFYPSVVLYGSYRREIHEWRVTPRKARGVHERQYSLALRALITLVFRGPHAPFVVSLAIRGFHVYMTHTCKNFLKGTQVLTLHI